MIMTGDDALEGMMHVMRCSQKILDVAVWIGTERYGGFSSYDHIAFFLRKRGLSFADVRIEECKE